MGLKALIQRLHAQAATPATPAKIEGLQRKPSVYKGCTPATPETPSISNAGIKVAKPAAPAAEPPPAASQQAQDGPHPTLEQLGAAALRACFAMGDDSRARRQMLDDCADLPEHERQGWIEHFRSTYGPIPAQQQRPAPTQAEPQQEPANDPALQDWRELDRAYLVHHAHCIQCKTAGRRRGERCSIGAALWRSYEDAPVPWASKGART